MHVMRHFLFFQLVHARFSVKVRYLWWGYTRYGTVGVHFSAGEEGGEGGEEEEFEERDA